MIVVEIEQEIIEIEIDVLGILDIVIEEEEGEEESKEEEEDFFMIIEEEQFVNVELEYEYFDVGGM